MKCFNIYNLSRTICYGRFVPFHHIGIEYESVCDSLDLGDSYGEDDVNSNICFVRVQ